MKQALNRRNRPQDSNGQAGSGVAVLPGRRCSLRRSPGRERSALATRMSTTVDEVGYIPSNTKPRNCSQLDSYEAASLIVTSNKPFGRWGEVFGDDVVAQKSDSYRLNDRYLGRVPASSTEEP